MLSSLLSHVTPLRLVLPPYRGVALCCDVAIPPAPTLSVAVRNVLPSLCLSLTCMQDEAQDITPLTQKLFIDQAVRPPAVAFG